MEATMKRKSEAGQSLLLVALGLVVVMGFAGLAVDVGVMRVEKRVQQTAADAAAIAAASNLAYSGWQAGGQGAAVANGFTDSSGNDVASCTASGATVGTICVEIDNGPADGPHAGNTSYVEARVAAVRPTYFMQLLGIPSESVTARAVATSVSGGSGSGTGCLYTLGSPSSAIEGVAITGKATLNATTCGIVDNGNYDPTGGALKINAGTFGVSGDCAGSGCKDAVTCTVTPDSCPTFGTPAGPNPMTNLTPPCSPCSGGTALKSTSSATFSPGTYTSITLSGNGTVTFNPGIYTINGGGFSCSGTPGISGTGVMFYLTNGATWNCQGNDNINLTAPTASNCPACAAQYDGILIYQDPADTNGASLGGNTGSTYNGVLYFPKAEVTFFGTATGIDVGIVVADAFALSGHPTVNLEGAAGLQGLGITVNDIKTAVLVE
jgi:Flp pilus assembly protein TadG